MSKLDHPRIVKVHEFDAQDSAKSDEKLIFGAMEYCSNGDLFDLMQRHKRLPEPVVRRFLSQIMEGLRYMN